MKDYSSLQNGSDIRGVAMETEGGKPVNLTLQAARDIGYAFGCWLSEKTGKPAEELKVAIGRDSRITGPSIALGIGFGLKRFGAEAFISGLSSTPAMFMCCAEGKYDGGIMVTASHLPSERNGAKFFTKESGLEKGDIKKLLAYAAAAPDDMGETTGEGELGIDDVMTPYVEGLKKKILDALGLPADAKPFEGMKIIVDAGNGAGGFFAERLLEPLGADTEGSQFLEPDGSFPNHQPNPENAEAMASITEAVIRTGADMGIIFDTDVDRAGAVLPDGNGGAKALDRNRLIAIMAAI
ncbi:MAG: phosphomannomutase/phosphoglucomutase, partial [Clostridia bacterium]|nr:phosphomannomutase/phosphoglucomutase [Clostridia bacterium]